MSRGERKAMIVRDRPELSLSRQCRLLSISRSSFYYTAKGESPANLALMRRIDELFLKYPFYGSRQMVRQLRRDGVRTGRHRVRRLMRLMGLEAIYQAPRTSTPHPAHRVYPYLLKGLAIGQPNQVWCADITYIPVQRGFLYLVAVMDWATRHVLGVAVVEHHRCPVLRRGLERGAGPIRHAEDLQYRPGQPVHQRRLYRRTRERGHQDIDGRPRPLHGQHLHRAGVALAQVRGGLPARARRRLQGRTGDWRVDRLLNTAPTPRWPDRPRPRPTRPGGPWI